VAFIDNEQLKIMNMNTDTKIREKPRIIYPSITVAPSIKTEFVNGIKFDVCEVIKESYDMLANKANRFFLCVEDSFIYKWSGVRKYFISTGETRWDLMCMTKGECLDLIREFQSAHESILKLQKKAEKPGFKASANIRIDRLRSNIKERFGASPV